VIVPYSEERVRQRAAVKKAQHRRRRMLVLLIGAALASAVTAISQGQPWLEIHLMLDGVLLFYVAMLHEVKRRRDEKLTKVRTLQRAPSEDVQILEPVSAGAERP
jgi:hypothetical protein